MRLVIEHVLARRAGHVQWDRTSWRVRHLQLERHDLIPGAAEPLLRKWEEPSNSHFLPPIFAALDDTRHGRSSRITWSARKSPDRRISAAPRNAAKTAG